MQSNVAEFPVRDAAPRLCEMRTKARARLAETHRLLDDDIEMWRALLAFMECPVWTPEVEAKFEPFHEALEKLSDRLTAFVMSDANKTVAPIREYKTHLKLQDRIS